jgi:Animal haem peroxidase
MFPRLHPVKLSNAAIDALVASMEDRRGPDNPSIPAGYTYLAQFVDHDITFDPASKLQGDNDPRALANFRTPRFDLDSLYGSGPKDQPFLYDWNSERHPGVKLLVGASSGEGTITADLPRNQQGRALIGDARNDENLIVAQLHLLFIRFHNKVVDHVRAAEPALGSDPLLEKAQTLVRWHYQWIVMHDLLRRLVGDDVVMAAQARRDFYRFRGDPFMPIEFSAAAYRFGHSMVRNDYTPNGLLGRPVAIFAVSDNPGELDHLGGFRRLPVPLAIDWTFFYELNDEKPPSPDQPQHSRTINTALATRLFRLRASVSGKREALARLNLRRGRALGLPSGAAVARAMHVEPLDEPQLLLDRLSAEVRKELLRAPPLWYYVLCEAESELGDDGRHLGPVGGRIVAEVLTGLLEADPSSYLHANAPWTPTLPRAACGDFTMPDLVRFALGEPAPHSLPPGC